MLELNNGTYKIGEKHILKDINVTFKENSFNILLGANGAGKSTLLKMATGLLLPTTGNILFYNKPIQHYTTQELALKRAVLSQSFDVAFSLTVQDIVLMGRYPYFKNNPTKKDVEIVEYAVTKVGMQDKLQQQYNTLSGGEKQKVQMARVLAQIWATEHENTSKYIFLDEPISNLDIKYQLEILNIAKELTSKNVTIVAVLHDINLAMQYGNEFYFLKDGEMILQTSNKDHIDETLLQQLFNVKAVKYFNKTIEQYLWHFTAN